MHDKAKREERRAQHAREVEESQAQLRKNISETERLVSESEKMLRRHRQEREEDDKDADQARGD
jgi:hypothetical protein